METLYWYFLHPDIWSLTPYTLPLIIISLVLYVKNHPILAIVFSLVFVGINGAQYNVHTGFEPTRLGIGLFLIGTGFLTEWARRRKQCSPF